MVININSCSLQHTNWYELNATKNFTRAFLRRFTRKRTHFFCAERASHVINLNMVSCQVNGKWHNCYISICVCHPCREWAAQFFALLLEVLRSLCISQSPHRVQLDIFSGYALVSVNLHYLIKLCMSVTYKRNLSALSSSPRFRWYLCSLWQMFRINVSTRIKSPSAFGPEVASSKTTIACCNWLTHANALLQVHCSDPSEGYPTRLWHQGNTSGSLTVSSFPCSCALSSIATLYRLGFSNSIKPHWHVPELACGNVVPYWGFGFK